MIFSFAFGDPLPTTKLKQCDIMSKYQNKTERLSEGWGLVGEDDWWGCVVTSLVPLEPVAIGKRRSNEVQSKLQN